MYTVYKNAMKFRIKVDKKKSLRETVYQYLKKGIVHGKIKGGVRLKEETLAHEIGISRTPVREALYKLEQDELLHKLPKGGFVVKKFTKEDVEDIFGIRSALESYAAYLVTIHITPQEIENLERKIEESEEALIDGDHKKLIKLNTEFHDLLYKSCKSKKLIDIINNFREYFYRYRSILLKTKAGFRYSIESHRKMLEAMKKKKPKEVERLVRQHLEQGKRIIINEIDAGRTTP